MFIQTLSDLTVLFLRLVHEHGDDESSFNPHKKTVGIGFFLKNIYVTISFLIK